MATTPYFAETLPTVGGDTNQWGDLNNDLHDAWDALIGVPNKIVRKTGSIVTGACAFDLSGATGSAFWELTVSADVTLTFSNTPSGTFASRFLVKLINGAAHTIVWPAAVTWLSAAPVLQASGVDLLLFTSNDNGTTWYGAHLRSTPPAASITTAMLQDNAVTTAKIPDDAITAAKAADGIIDAAAKIVDGVITAEKLAAGVLIPTVYSCRLGLSSSPALSGETVIAWTSEGSFGQYDEGGIHAANSTDIVVPVGGKGIWLIIAQLDFSGTNGAGTRTVRIKHDGNERGKAQSYRDTGSVEDVVQVSAVVTANDGAVFTVTGQSTTAQNIQGASVKSWVTATRLQKLS